VHRKNIKILLFIAGFIFICNNSWGQTQVDSTSITKKNKVLTEQVDLNDTIKIKTHSPKKAALYSALVPGLGQVYNKKYWKLPIVYTASALAAGLIYYNYSVYNNIHKSIRYRYDEDPTTSLETFSVRTLTGKLNVDLTQFDNSELIDLQDLYRNDLDLSVILAAGVYGLNILDAVVDAHLFNFNVNNDLSIKITPNYTPALFSARPYSSVSFRMTF